MLLKNKFVENKKKRKYKTAKATAGNIGGGTALLANSHNTTISSHHNTRRFSHQRHQQQNIDQQQQQQQVQVQVQQQQIQIHQHQHQHHSPARSPLAALSSVAIRNTNELGVTTTTPTTTTTTTNEVCDNSNDSGLGIEDRQQHQSNTSWNNGAIGEEDSKRRKMDIKLESEDANFTFPDVTKSGGGSSRTDNKIMRNTNVNTTRTNNNGSVGRVIGVTRPRSSLGVYGKRPSTTHQGPITLTSQLCTCPRCDRHFKS